MTPLSRYFDHYLTHLSSILTTCTLLQSFAENLKIHLLPRIQKRLCLSPAKFDSNISAALPTMHNTVLIKDNRIYNHKLARFYHTTYDVRRSEDVINPNTSHSNIMLLADRRKNNSSSNSSNEDAVHPFIYGRVIGIYHVNVIYTGLGMQNYDAMRFDFLHVRWLQLDPPQSQSQSNCGWTSLRLDRLSFPPMADNSSFSFVDPSLVLRGCHLIPAYAFGKARSDGVGMSKISKDFKDWKYYYVNRFVVFCTSAFQIAEIF